MSSSVTVHMRKLVPALRIFFALLSVPIVRVKPYQENQSFAENHYGTIKTDTNMVFNPSGAPEDCWLLALEYVCHVLYLFAGATLSWIPPLQAQEPSTPLVGAFYEPVYYNSHYDGFLSNSNKVLGRWVGAATNVGDAVTFKLHTPCNQVVFRSVI